MPVTLEKATSHLTIGKYLLDSLYSRGVRHVFGIPGDYVLRLDKLIEEHELKFINTTQENTAGYMADAYARIRGLGCACITYGVGLTVVNAMSQAFAEDSPIVLISGSAGTDEYVKNPILHHMINRQPLAAQEFDVTQLDILKNVTIDQAVLTNPETAADEIDRVLDACLKHKKPVYIEIPRNRVDSPIPTHSISESKTDDSYSPALQESLKECEEVFLKAQKPLIWIGHELTRYDLADAVTRFAEAHQIPIVSSLLGKTAISERHPLFAGVYAGAMSRPEVQKLVEDTDCIVLLGVMLHDIDTAMFTAKVDYETRISASVKHVEINNHIYSNVQLNDFISGLGNLKFDKIYERKVPARSDTAEFKAVADQKTTTSRLFSCIQSHLKPENIVFSDVGDCMFGSADLILEKNSYWVCSFFASLGFGTPGAIATQLALPEKRVIGIIGDGAFQMTCMELTTAVRYHLDPIIIVLNNHGYGTERPLLEGAYNDIQDWNYYEIPRVLGGGKGVKVETEEALDNALKDALKQRGEFWIIQVELGKLDFSPALSRFAEKLRQRAGKQTIV